MFTADPVRMAREVVLMLLIVAVPPDCKMAPVVIVRGASSVSVLLFVSKEEIDAKEVWRNSPVSLL